METKYKYPKLHISFYLAGAAWIVYALFFPLYRTGDYIIALIASAAVFAVSILILPKEKTNSLKRTGDDKLDEMIADANGYILKINAANAKIKDAAISAKISRIQELVSKIFLYVKDNPEQRSDVRRFINYYLPTTVKLLDTYENLSAQNMSTANISSTMKKIEDMLETICGAFEKQLDSLYANKALDISTDITVMENIMSGEGLIGESIADKLNKA